MRLGKLNFVFIALNLCFGCGRVASDTSEIQFAREAAVEPELLLSFVGKGSALGWDVGVLQAALSGVKINNDGTVIVGNSSGAGLAAYFACHGITPASVQGGRELIDAFARTNVNEDPMGKWSSFVGLDPAYDPVVLEPVLNGVTAGCDFARMRPLVIVAGNNEVVENRFGQPGFSILPKHFHESNYEVTQWTGSLGKACTYFANAAMVKLLQTIPYEERQCDLRRIDDEADLRLAVLASFSEPTFFPPVPEADPAKFVDGVDPASEFAWRRYNGGFVMTAFAQDARRVLPTVRVLGTGRRLFALPDVASIYYWFLLDLNRTLALGKWWLDMEVLPNREVWRTISDQRTSHRVVMHLGCEAARACFVSDQCFPDVVLHPRFDYDATYSLPGAVETQRGLGPLLADGAAHADCSVF